MLVSETTGPGSITPYQWRDGAFTPWSAEAAQSWATFVYSVPLIAAPVPGAVVPYQWQNGAGVTWASRSTQRWNAATYTNPATPLFNSYAAAPGTLAPYQWQNGQGAAWSSEAAQTWAGLNYVTPFAPPSNSGAQLTWKTAQYLPWNSAVGYRQWKQAFSLDVVSTITEGSLFAWNANFAWNSPDGKKTWVDSAPNTYTLAIAEGFQNAESPAKGIAKPFAESWANVASYANNTLKLALVALSTAETWADQSQFNINLSEGWTTTEMAAKSLLRGFIETWNTSESISNADSLGIQEMWTTSEAYARVSGFGLALSEGLTTTDALVRAMQLSKPEMFNTADVYLRHANAVLSDIIISTDDMELTDFQAFIANGHAPGFSDFQTFLPGDYAYQQTILRAVMTSATAERGNLRSMQLIVTAPDVNDAGTASITDAAAGISVTFAKLFHTPPEVTLTLKGGTVIAIPSLVGATTTTGFTATLTSLTGVLVTGEFSWAAHGV